MDIDPIGPEQNMPVELPHYLLDNLPAVDFQLTIDCKLDGVKSITSTEFLEHADKPDKVLIDARNLNTGVFASVMSAYLSDKQQHPHKTACIITGKNLTSSHQNMHLDDAFPLLVRSIAGRYCVRRGSTLSRSKIILLDSPGE